MCASSKNLVNVSSNSTGTSGTGTSGTSGTYDTSTSGTWWLTSLIKHREVVLQTYTFKSLFSLSDLSWVRKRL